MLVLKNTFLLLIICVDIISSEKTFNVVHPVRPVANILCIYPSASFSHHQPFKALTKTLLERGLNLTVITPFPLNISLKALREIDISFILDFFLELQKDPSFSLQKLRDRYEFIRNLPDLFEVVVEKILKSPQIQNLIEEFNKTNTKYDLIIYEALHNSAFLGFSNLLGNPPLIGITTSHTSSQVDEELGNPIIPSYIPHLFSGYSDNMTFFERMDNLCMTLNYQFMFKFFNAPKQEKLMEKYFGHGKYSAYEIEHNKSLLLVSADLATGYSKPIHQNTLYVGPLHIHEPKELPEDLKTWMDDAEKGVIYFNFGTNMKGVSVNKEIRKIFIKVFKQFPKMHVLWKLEQHGQPKLPNIMTKDWFPQQSILAHPSKKIFITQCGMQSFQEAIHYQVPVLCIPLFADQFFNARVVENKEIGQVLNLNNISYTTLMEKLETLINDYSYYKKNVRQLSEITNDRLMSPLENAAWWVDYVLKYKGMLHVRPASLDLYWFQLYMLDILAFSVMVMCLGILLVLIYFKQKKLPLLKDFILAKCKAIRKKFVRLKTHLIALSICGKHESWCKWFYVEIIFGGFKLLWFIISTPFWLMWIIICTPYWLLRTLLWLLWCTIKYPYNIVIESSSLPDEGLRRIPLTRPEGLAERIAQRRSRARRI